MNANLVDVLIVEDNLDDAELTIRELKKHTKSAKFFHVKDGEEALQFIFATGKYSGKRNISNLPGIVLLDIKMPKVSGIEVLEKIKSDSRTQLVPVVMLTSSNESPDIKKCYDLGANSYIVKPVHFDDFASAIKNVGAYWLILNQHPSG
jgi:two-component system, response regulator